MSNKDVPLTVSLQQEGDMADGSERTFYLGGKVRIEITDMDERLRNNHSLFNSIGSIRLTTGKTITFDSQAYPEVVSGGCIYLRGRDRDHDNDAFHTQNYCVGEIEEAVAEFNKQAARLLKDATPRIDVNLPNESGDTTLGDVSRMTGNVPFLAGGILYVKLGCGDVYRVPELTKSYLPSDSRVRLASITINVETRDS